MNLDEAFDYIDNVYVRSAKEDVRGAKLITAIKIILAAHPEARSDMIGYWKAMEFDPDLPINHRIGKTATCHPWMRRVFRACGRD